MNKSAKYSFILYLSDQTLRTTQDIVSSPKIVLFQERRAAISERPTTRAIYRRSTVTFPSSALRAATCDTSRASKNAANGARRRHSRSNPALTKDESANETEREKRGGREESRWIKIVNGKVGAGQCRGGKLRFLDHEIPQKSPENRYAQFSS